MSYHVMTDSYIAFACNQILKTKYSKKGKIQWVSNIAKIADASGNAMGQFELANMHSNILTTCSEVSQTCICSRGKYNNIPGN